MLYLETGLFTYLPLNIPNHGCQYTKQRLWVHQYSLFPKQLNASPHDEAVGTYDLGQYLWASKPLNIWIVTLFSTDWLNSDYFYCLLSNGYNYDSPKDIYLIMGYAQQMDNYLTLRVKNSKKET